MHGRGHALRPLQVAFTYITPNPRGLLTELPRITSESSKSVFDPLAASHHNFVTLCGLSLMCNDDFPELILAVNSVFR